MEEERPKFEGGEDAVVGGGGEMSGRREERRDVLFCYFIVFAEAGFAALGRVESWPD